MRGIKAEQKRLKRERGRFRKGWLARRQAALNRYVNALGASLDLGRAIGDGFAWFFYEKDRRLIGEHLKHPKQADLPIGIGGLGERLFVRGIRVLDGRMAIYHGTTTFLRIGDVSFIDLPSRRVHALGELKTRKVADGEYRLMLHLVAGSEDLIPKPKPTTRAGQKAAEAAPEPPLRPEIQARLETQIRRMHRAVGDAKGKKPATRIGHPADFYFGDLADLVRRSHSGSFTFAQTGPAMVIGAYRWRGGAAFSNDLIDSRADVGRMIKGIKGPVVAIGLKGRMDNALYIDTPGYGRTLTVTLQGLPPAWWPMDDDALADILFGRVMIVSVYNSAHLRAAMETRGLIAQLGTDSLKGEFEGRKLELGVISHFDRMIQHCFMSLESTLELIDQSLRLTREQGVGRGVTVSIHAQVTTGDAAHEEHSDPG